MTCSLHSQNQKLNLPMKILKHCKYFIAALLFPFIVNAQEVLIPLSDNPIIKKHLIQNPGAQFRLASAIPLDLPVIDDFSSVKVYPDPLIWSDNYVFINDDFPRNPLTVGVATFDGLDAEGNAYDNSVQTASGPCDTLTSQPVFLLTKPASAGGGQYTLADSITLSFYYQKKGWGDSPETTDSLVVEYLNASTGVWYKQWFATGGTSGGQDSIWNRVELRILDVNYLQDGFKFRFRNFGARTGNLDQWHIDYVRLYKAYNNNTGQMDTSLVDVAFTQPGRSLLNNHTSIPWEHFIFPSTDQQGLIKDSSTVYYRVNDNFANDVGFNNRIFDFNMNYVAGNGAANGNIFPGRPNNINLSYTFPVDSVFPNTPSVTPDSNYFWVLDYFSNSNAFGGLKSNDTIRYKQEFYNYYSYDDGTAEAGYDLINAPGGRLAMKFDILKPDTLRAVRFAFVQQALDVSTKLFTIKIYSSLNPETVIYQELNQRPAYIDQINGYATYVLDQVVPVSGTIYVGFQQVGGDGLHLGYDRNMVSNSNMFFNISGSWNTVLVAPGTFMIRPVMGDTTLFVGLDEQQVLADVSVYPNPAKDNLYLKADFTGRIHSVIISDIHGREIMVQPYSERYDISRFSSGVYFITVRYDKGVSVTRRFTVTQ